MDHPALDLAQELQALARLGCEVRITPQESPLGYLFAEVVVTPPRPDDPRSMPEEVEAFGSGVPVSLPYSSTLHLYYDWDKLPEILRAARLLYTPR